jgi:alcohol dehydrogenase class IV
MLLGAMEAGFAMNTGCALIHSSGLQLTSKFGLSHGETLAIMAGPVMRFNTMACVDRMIDIAKAMSENVYGLGKLDAAYKAAEAVQKYAESIEVPVHLTKEAHDPSVISHMAQNAISNDNTFGNPRIPTQEQLETLYRQAYRDLNS